MWPGVCGSTVVGVTLSGPRLSVNISRGVFCVSCIIDLVYSDFKPSNDFLYND